MLALKLVIGSTREGRAADLLLPWLVERLSARADFELEVLDLRDWPLPMFAETRATIGDPADPTYSAPIVKDWNRVIASGDAFVFLTPEYNHSVPGVLKNALDNVFVSFGLRNKPSAFVAYSTGLAAGVRAVEHLAHMIIESDGVPLRNTVLVPYVLDAFEDGAPKNPITEYALTVMLDDLAWWGTALQRARAEGQLPPGGVRLRALQAEAAAKS